ncbi:YbjN domain-containing protein [Naumannella sp. ID2617S]|nr:YbjN domain-containing protein [Naumannella sp. ID2617S]
MERRELTAERDRARSVVEQAVAELELESSATADTIRVTLLGTRKLQTECALVFGGQAMEVRAFVARNPDENHAAVYRWLLERNLRTYAVAFCTDRLGDIYLIGKVPFASVTPEEVDRVLGSVAEVADDSFNTILELGFASSIRKEWQWRISRGESTANLAAFQHLAEPAESQPE